MLIAIEGPNCSGKTTIINKIADHLKMKYSIYITKEPTNDWFGDILRVSEDRFNPMTYMFLITANRSEHNYNEIIPNMDKIILCDRYIASSLALQSSQGIPIDFIWDVNKKFIMPDITIFLSAPPQELKLRLEKRNNKSYFENYLSREQEIQLYKKAYEYMKEKNMKVWWLENGKENITVNYRKIIKLIEEEKNEKKY